MEIEAGKEDHGLECQAKEYALYLTGLRGPLKIVEYQNNDINFFPVIALMTELAANAFSQNKFERGQENEHEAKATIFGYQDALKISLN